MNLAIALWLTVTAAGLDPQVLPLLDRGHAEPAMAGRGMLNAYLMDKTSQALHRRMQRYELLRTPEQIAEYQQRLRRQFVEQLGGFPQPTPLRARITGQIEADGYRIEKLIYESQPGFPVTALLYLPLGDPPYPAVLHPCGHSSNGKAAESYQRANILMARNGLAVLCIDPLGQGERSQLARDAIGATSQHMRCGVAPILLGQNLARYMIWDVMRGIDYLASRPDIDASRIGCTGNSGGGMMTSYMMALDDRVACAAPGCFITTLDRKNVSPGPGDAEQNVHAQIAHGIDHPDFLLMRAPRPTLICAATRDFVPIEGAWEAFRQAKRLATRLGFPERVALVEADEPHGFSQPLRVATTAWMRRWLLDLDAPLTEPPTEVHTDGQLQCTPDGQVQKIPGVRSVFELYGQAEAALAAQRRTRWQTAPKASRLQEVRRLAGIRPLSELPAPAVVRLAVEDRQGVAVEKLVLEPEPGIVLPALLFRPQQPSGRWMLYIDGSGKQAATEAGSLVQQRVGEGQTVLAIDLRGYGETQTNPWRYRTLASTLGPNAAEYYLAYMLGRSLVGMRAEDLLNSARFLRDEMTGPHDERIELVAVGHAGVPALHAAALEPELWGSIRLHQTLDSWHDVIGSDHLGDWQLENAVHGALTQYDLPDLRRTIDPGSLEVLAPHDASGRPLDDR